MVIQGTMESLALCLLYVATQEQGVAQNQPISTSHSAECSRNRNYCTMGGGTLDTTGTILKLIPKFTGIQATFRCISSTSLDIQFGPLGIE